MNAILCQHKSISKFSACCSRLPAYEETDFCGGCKEHTTFEKVCDECGEEVEII